MLPDCFAELAGRPLKIAGVGAGTLARLAKLGIRDLRDLLLHFPRVWQDRRTAIVPAGRPPEEAVYIRAVVRAHRYQPGRGRRAALLRILLDVPGQAGAAARGVTLLCFNRAFLAKAWPEGTGLHIWGVFEETLEGWSCSSFEAVPEQDRQSTADFGRVVPVYGLTEGLPQRTLRRILFAALSSLHDLEPILPEYLREKRRFPSSLQLLRAAHFPETPEEGNAARDALAYSEFLLFEIRILMRRAHLAASRKEHAYTAEDVLPEIERVFGFRCTPGQSAAWQEIRGALLSPVPMQRLLMGDVGSGKTVLAAAAILLAARSGIQAALAAPTVILARQLYERLERCLAPLGVRMLYVHGGQRAKERRTAALLAASGEVDLVVGTHVLFQEDITFNALGLVIIDEQHRFGVRQRSALREKGARADYLAMSATPIPRTLALSLYGDFELTSIQGLPEGRQPIRTRLARTEEEVRAVYQELEEHIAQGGQGYLIYPAIGEQAASAMPAAGERLEFDEEISHIGADPARAPLGAAGGGARGAPSIENADEEIVLTDMRSEDSAAGMERALVIAYEKLRRSPLAALMKRQGRDLALLHGRLLDDEKIRVMRDFAAGNLALLVSTSVIEVGIDNPNANIIIIHGAERFGLSQLHQLRGRVGRGKNAAVCYLISDERSGEESLRRLDTMVTSQDGFHIAEADLAQRGPGDFLGSAQAGLPRFTVADLSRDFRMLSLARQDAKFILQRDPSLLSGHNAPLARACRQEQGGYE